VTLDARVGDAHDYGIDVRKMALAFADIDAERGEYESALQWIRAVEELDGKLSPEVYERSKLWRRRARREP
jgi:hypothetical protein